MAEEPVAPLGRERPRPERAAKPASESEWGWGPTSTDKSEQAVQMRTLAIALISILATSATVSLQTASAPIPRLPDGHPDLQGTYDIATLTPLARQAGAPAVLTAAQAKALEKRVADQNARAATPSKANREAPPVGGDGSAGPAGNVGGYNNFWLDSGTELITINGEKRTSIIIDPPDGRVPPLTPEARQRIAARAVQTTSDAQARESDP
jgi:hypothetical protein